MEMVFTYPENMIKALNLLPHKMIFLLYNNGKYFNFAKENGSFISISYTTYHSIIYFYHFTDYYSALCTIIMLNLLCNSYMNFGLEYEMCKINIHIYIFCIFNYDIKLNIL